jgi:hypothetical protein
MGWHAFFLLAISKFVYLVINGAYRYERKPKILFLCRFREVRDLIDEHVQAWLAELGEARQSAS